MILMWLGSFVLMLFGLAESQKHISMLFQNLQKSFLDKGLDASFGYMLVRSLDVVVLEASPQKSLYSGMALFNLRILGRRAGILVMCLNILGAWWPLILGMLFLSFNGFFLLGLCTLGFINVGPAPKLKSLLQWLFATGLFLVGGEMMLRSSSVVQTLLGQSEWAFFLADGRFGAVIGILLISVVLTFAVKVEFWSLALGLGLLVTNTLSFNGALALVAGERIGTMIIFWWRSRGLSLDCRKIGRQLAGFSILGVLVGFIVAGEVRSLSSFQDKSVQFVLMFAIILFFQFVAQMAWGHFASQVKDNDMPEAKYFPVFWLQHEMLAPAAVMWAKEKIHKRLSEIKYHLQGLGTLKEGQVPEQIQARLREEEVQLSGFLR